MQVEAHCVCHMQHWKVAMGSRRWCETDMDVMLLDPETPSASQGTAFRPSGLFKGPRSCKKLHARLCSAA